MKAEQKSYPQSDNVSAVALRWEGIEAPAAEDSPQQIEKTETHGDPVDQAIAELERALDEYGDEMTASK
jgi:hypothetical protein